MGLAATFVGAGLEHAFVGHRVITDAVAFLPAPELVATLLSWAELLAGLGLAAGLLVAPAVGVVLLVGLGALATYHSPGIVARDLPMVGAAAYVLASLPGPASLDAALAARWPRLRPAATPLARGIRAGTGVAAMRAALGAALLAAPPAALLAGGGWLAVGDALAPGLGVSLFLARGGLGAMVLLGASPWIAAAGVAGMFAFQAAVQGFDYGNVPPVAAALGLALTPGARGAWLAPLAARRARPAVGDLGP
jgi:uncharacterized membrane protein YphA (DoxX/SURF4 family)